MCYNFCAVAAQGAQSELERFVKVAAKQKTLNNQSSAATGVSPVLTFVAVAACSLASFALFRN